MLFFFLFVFVFWKYKEMSKKKSSHVFLQETMFPRKSPLRQPVYRSGVRTSNASFPPAGFFTRTRTESVDMNPEEDDGDGGKEGLKKKEKRKKKENLVRFRSEF